MTNNVKLNEKEEFYFESEQILVTNLRVFAIQKKAFEGDSVWDEISISDTSQPEPKNAGKISRKSLGINLSLVGFGLMGFQIIPYMIFQINLLSFLGGFFEGLYFLVSMGSLVTGVYLLLNAFLTPNPHTAVLIPIIGQSKDFVVSFPGWDNPKVQELIRQYNRAKRSI